MAGMGTPADQRSTARGPVAIYSTELGKQYSGDSLDLLRTLPDKSVDLIVTSPPFALLRTKSYGNKPQSEYVEWLLEFGRRAKPILKDSGSFVVELGGAYKRGRPVRSIYNYRLLIAFCDTLAYELAEEFFWYNPAKLPSPTEWVNKRKIRVKDAVTPIWWFSKTDSPKADVRRVLVDYSARMKELLEDPATFYKPGLRPSAHQVSNSFGRDNGGAIPANLLRFPNTESTSHYLRACKLLGERSHSARFPAALPRFFIRFLTEPGDTVLDIFSGSNTTGYVSEQEGRRWISCDVDTQQARLSAVRFMDGWADEKILATWRQIAGGEQVRLAEAAQSRGSAPPTDASVPR